MGQFFSTIKMWEKDNLFTFENSELWWIDDMGEGLNSSPQEQGGKPPQGGWTACNLYKQKLYFKF